MFQGARWPFVVVSALAVVGLILLLSRTHTFGLRRVAYSLILAGAAGNLVDRIFYDGLVVDFIEMRWREHVFPVYNVADMGVSIGAALLVLSMLREKDEPAVAESTATTDVVDASPPDPSAEEASDDDLARPTDRARADDLA